MATSMTFSDSHCHLDFDELAALCPALLQRCADSGIRRIVVPSIGPDNWHKVLQLAGRSTAVSLYPCLGIHPWFLKGLSVQTLDELATLAKTQRDRLIAIGECGIDQVIAKQQDNGRQQQDFFQAQIVLAQQLKLPLIVHHRQSHDDIIRCLRAQQFSEGGIIHAFSGSVEQGKCYLDLGFKLGIGGTISYPRARKTIRAVQQLPLEAMVLETDAPAMPLAGFQGQANSPLQLIEVFKHLTALRPEPAEVIAQQLEQNLNQILRLAP